MSLTEGAALWLLSTRPPYARLVKIKEASLRGAALWLLCTGPPYVRLVDIKEAAA